MSPEKLVRMANQIAAFHAAQRGDAAAAVAAHLNDFWEPRMRAQLLSLIAAGCADLHPAVVSAAPLIRQPA